MVPEDFVGHLRTHVEGLAAESERHQWHLALMAWLGSQKRRQHLTEPGAMTFSFEELEREFGRGKFAPLFHRLDFFKRSAGWNYKAGITMAYWFSAQVRDAIANYLASPPAPASLLWLSGKKLKIARRLRSGVSSTDTNRRPVRTGAWDCAKHLNRVPINREMMGRLHDWLVKTLQEEVLDDSLRRFIERLHDITVKIIRMEANDLAGPGHIQQVYSIAPTGRLYARGLNLQNAPGLIKDAALHGLWDYDISNCHFSIMFEMASKVGVRCTTVEHYLANKARVRQEIADGAAITIDQVKRCLLAVLYGARASGRTTDAIPAAITIGAAKRLYAIPVFDALRREIEQARAAILRAWPRTANGSLTNAFGKAILGSAKPSARLAHLTQGVEAKALRAMVAVHAADIVLLQHDGFTARRRLNTNELEKVVFEQTGYRLKVEERQLELHADARELMSRTKSEMALEAAPDLAVDSVSAD